MLDLTIFFPISSIIGKGSGLSFQNLLGYTHVTTGATVIGPPEAANHYAPSKSLLAGSIRAHENTMSPLDLNSCGFPIDFNPKDFLVENGNMVLWNDVLGGKYPWDPRYFSSNPNINGFDNTYILQHATDSANTAGCLATGHKAAVGMLSVDLYEESVSTIVEDAMFCSKSGGVVSSVPMFHATPGAFITHAVSRGATEVLRRTFLAVNPTIAS
jgi:alkaline phosphatase